MTLALVCASKVLVRGQYLLWLLPAACAGLAVVRSCLPPSRVGLRARRGRDACAASSDLPSPFSAQLAIHGPHTVAAIPVLGVRNLLLVPSCGSRQHGWPSRRPGPRHQDPGEPEEPEEDSRRVPRHRPGR